MRKNKIVFWFFIAPAIVSFLLIVVIPAVIGFFYSFTDWNGLSANSNFVGLNNFTQIFVDKRYIHSLYFTTAVAFVSIILINSVAILLALLVTQKFKGSNFLRGLFFMPNLIGGLLLGFAWRFVFTKIFEALAKITGLGFLNAWLTSTTTGFWGIIIVNVWQMSGYMMLIYIAQLQQIPSSVKEAAKIDGAGAFQTFRNITFPLIMPAFTIGVFLSIANSFKMFDQNIALTDGAPYHSTEMLALNIYSTAFSSGQLGLAQAKSVIFLIIVATVGVTQLIITKRKEVEM